MRPVHRNSHVGGLAFRAGSAPRLSPVGTGFQFGLDLLQGRRYVDVVDRFGGEGNSTGRWTVGTRPGPWVLTYDRLMASRPAQFAESEPVSYTHLRAHETRHDL